MTLLALLAAGCSDDSNDDSPDAALPDASPPDTAAPDAGLDTLSWSSCGTGRVQCATMVVPVDYNNSGDGTMELALLRWPALSTVDRIGVLVFHPGGPGVSGVEAARALPEMLVPAAGEVVRRFDIIGIDMRGTGSSTPAIDCFNVATGTTSLSAIAQAKDDGEVDALITEGITACRDKVGTGVLPHFDTVSAARDVDRLRQLLGEDKLSILGGSYGTWFATVYASLYPERVRAAVLPSALPASNDVFDRQEVMIRGTEAALTAFFSWCDASTTCAFRPATGTTRQGFDALTAAIIASPLLSSLGLALGREIFRSVVERSLLFPNYESLATMLAAAEAGNPDPMLQAFSMSVDAMKDSQDDVIVIRSLDDTIAPGATVDDWRARLTKIREAAPSLGALVTDRELLVRVALVWTDHPNEPFAVKAIPSAPPFLVLTGDNDPVTPVEGAMTLVAALGNGSVILDTQNIGHDSLSGPCALSRSQNYLLDPTSLAGSPTNVACPEPAPDEAIVGTVSAVYPWNAKSSRLAESELGDLVADAMRASAGTQISVVNGGGIRTALPSPKVLPADTSLRRPEAGYAQGPPFDVVVDDLRAMLPFGNRMITTTVSGAQLHNLLEHAVSTYDGIKGQGEFLQVSGVQMTFDPKAAAGARLKSLTLAGGEDIADDPSTIYTLALPDYVWYGGTGYFSLVRAATSAPKIGATLDDAVIAYLKDNSLTPGKDLIPFTDGRIAVSP